MMSRSFCLATIKSQCHFTYGFEEAFAHIEMFMLTALVTAIEEHTPVEVMGYHEYVDFLDGNGFSVRHDICNWYIITPLNT